MGNVIRLGNGGRVQVRTGVLAGVGPEGALGPVGPQGQQGEQGPVGPEGPIGQILQISTQVKVSATQALTAATSTLTAFGTVAYNDLGVVTDSTTYTINETGDYLLSVWVMFDASEESVVSILNTTDNETLTANSAVGTHNHACQVQRFFAAGKQIKVYTKTTTGSNLIDGRFTITRTGSGPRGVDGPTGATGPSGPQGLTGPQGAPGNASGGYATYSDLKA